MHIPVFICGLAFGPVYGLICGIITPIVSSLLTGMPVLFPMAVIMVFELGTYGFASGLFYRKFGYNLYVSMILAMLCGRIVNGIVSTVIYHFMGTPYSFETFLTASFITSLPGIVLQLIFVPLIVLALQKSHLIQSNKII